MKTETTVSNLKINRGTYANIQANLSSIGENELIITTDKNIPVPTTNDNGKVIQVNSSGEYELGSVSIPTKDSDLTNDRYVRYDTASQGLTTTQKSNARTNIGAGTSNFSGSYNDLSNKPTLGTAAAKAFTTSVTSGSNDLVTSGAVYTAIDNLPEPMVFKGTLGTGGTITTLPTASSSNEGFTYKVITAGTYASIVAKVGDVFVSNGSDWILIPAGDDIEDTWRNIKVNGTELLGSAISTGAINFKNGSNVTITGSGNDITIASSYTDTNQKVKTSSVTFGNDDVVEIKAGSNITVTGDASAKTITIAGTANDNQTVKGNGTAFGSNDAIDIVGGGATTVTADTTNKKITISTPSVTDTNQKVKAGSVTFGNDDVVNFVGDGIVSVTGDATNDKITISASHQSIKTLDTTATTSQSTSASEAIAGSGKITLHKISKTGDYSDLVNKPTIPTVNNGKLSIQGNGTTASEFTANSSSDVTLNIKGSGATTVSKTANNEITVSSTDNNDNQKIKVGSSTFGANDVINLVAGDNVTITPLTSGTGAPKITISASDTVNCIEITYANLKTARDGGTLVPGMWYRITDYQCSTVTPNTSSANNQFDILVLATSTNTLGEECRAIKHSGDSYFANSNLEAWKIWYCLDNDTNRFAWADGQYIVIENNIFSRYSNDDDITKTYGYAWRNVSYASSSSIYRGNMYTNTLNPTTSTLAYISQNGTGPSFAISSVHQESGKGVIYRMIDEFNNDCPFDFKNILVTTGQQSSEINIYTFGVHDDISLNALIHDNIVKETKDYDKKRFVLGFHNLAGWGTGQGRSYKGFDNYIGYDCYRNEVYGSCNKIGNECHYLFVEGAYNKIGNNNNNSSITSLYCSIGDNCEAIYLNGNYGDYLNINIGNGCKNIDFIYESGYDLKYVQNIIIEDGCSYLEIGCLDNDESDENYLQNVHIHMGVNGTSDSYKTITIPDRNLPYSTEVWADGTNNMVV